MICAEKLLVSTRPIIPNSVSLSSSPLSSSSSLPSSTPASENTHLHNICTSKEKSSYKRPLNGTIHVVGSSGVSLSNFTTIQTSWSVYRDYDFGFVNLTAFDHSNLLFEYKKSSNGKVDDSSTISRDYRDILACTVDNCPRTTLAS